MAKSLRGALSLELKSYLELVELTGRCMREDRCGHIEQRSLPVLERLSIAPENWLKLTTQFTKVFKGAVGRPNKLDDYYTFRSKTANQYQSIEQRLG